MLTRPDTRFARENRIQENPDFWAEATALARVADLYGSPGFPELEVRPSWYGRAVAAAALPSEGGTAAPGRALQPSHPVSNGSCATACSISARAVARTWSFTRA